MKANKFKTIVLVFIGLCSVSTQAQKFKVVIDPGHGGKDFGAVRSNYVEKKVVLDVGLRLGEILSKESDIEVVYTRKTDVFIPLRKRSEIANDAKADVFISLHANASVSKESYGTETFVMGQSKSASNLEVAKKENTVITLEDDYKTKYSGFDPNNPESLIGLTLVQEQYISQSIDLASKVQGNFTNDLKRKNRGVKQAPFWVLHGAFMPSILIELGFVSHPQEGAYLNSDEGRQELATSLSEAILSYKKVYYNPNVLSSANEKEANDLIQQTITKETQASATNEPVKKITENNSTANRVEYMVQIASSSKKVALVSENFKGLQNVSMIQEGVVFKYFYNSTNDIAKARESLKVAKAKGYSTAFIVAYKNGLKVSLQQALK